MLSAKQVQSGKSGQIEVSVNTQGLMGALDKSVNITTNDPRQPVVTLNVKAIVEPEISVSEPSIYFGTVPKGKEVTKEIYITLPADKPIRILSAESMDQNVAVKIEPVPGTNGKKAKLKATQKADAKIGYHFGRIVVKTTSSLTPEISIYVRGVIAALSN